MNLMIVSGMFVCSSFLIHVCMFVESFAHIECYSGGIWLNPFATVLFSVCRAVTVEGCVCTRVAWVCLVCTRQEVGSSHSLETT